MIPQLEGFCLGPQAAEVPPPTHFRALAGEPKNVKHYDLRREQAMEGTATQKNGVRYERKAQLWLEDHIPRYLPSQQFTFDDGPLQHRRTIIPDGVFAAPNGGHVFSTNKEDLKRVEISGNMIGIVEIKINHTPDAWWKLERLYRPVLHAFRPSAKIVCIEVVKRYDPAVVLPGPHKFVKTISELLDQVFKPCWPIETPEFLVFEWRP